MDLLTVAHRDAPAVDMALSALLLEEVAAGNRPPLIRLYTPGSTARRITVPERRQAR
jgi:hypothetical protein